MVLSKVKEYQSFNSSFGVLMILHCSGYNRQPSPEASYADSENWEIFFQTQTLLLCETGEENAFYVFYRSFEKEDLSRLPHTLLEKMAWALTARLSVDILFLPLHISMTSKFNSVYENPEPQLLKQMLADGYIAVSRSHECAHFGDQDLLSKLHEKELKSGLFTHAALEVKKTCPRYSPLRALGGKMIKTLRYRLPRPVKTKGRQVIELVRIMANSSDSNPDACIPDKDLARRKTWDPAYSEISVQAVPRDVQPRVPVLFAMHWLELGGAEKFAVDLIKALPKTRFAVYVTTDVPSQNSWENEIKNHVEELFHLPEFLPGHLMKVFYKEFIKTRKIKLFHIHHAPGAYESLPYLRRFFPELVVMDTLHIIELPPNTGGYPEYSGRHFSPFINQHHVISHLLKNFLIQRWHISKNKISAIYLNVDTEYFNPDLVENNFLRSKLNIPENAFLVGFIGRMVEQKQPMVFVTMAKNIRDRSKNIDLPAPIYYVMVGSGPLMQAVKKRTARYGLDNRLFFHDEVSDTRPVYKDLDLVVMPSANEGLALVAYESMAMKTPVVFSDVGAQSELMAPQYLVAPGKNETSRFADKVMELAHFPEKLEKTGDSLRDYILRRHRAQDTFDQMIKLYENLLSPPAS